MKSFIFTICIIFLNTILGVTQVKQTGNRQEERKSAKEGSRQVHLDFHNLTKSSLKAH